MQNFYEKLDKINFYYIYKYIFIIFLTIKFFKITNNNNSYFRLLFVTKLINLNYLKVYQNYPFSSVLTKKCKLVSFITIRLTTLMLQSIKKYFYYWIEKHQLFSNIFLLSSAVMKFHLQFLPQRTFSPSKATAMAIS